MEFRNKEFEGERVELSGNVFHNCTFRGCELVFDGSRSPTFNDNEFIDSTFVFTGAAASTLYFLGNIYHAGSGGADVVDKILRQVREGTVHGTELKTSVPETADHSLH